MWRVVTKGVEGAVRTATKVVLAAGEAALAQEPTGAGLDVLVDTAPPSDHPLFKLDNVLITPHVAFFSQESTLELEQRAAGEVVRVLQGHMPDNLVNPSVLAHPSPRHGLSEQGTGMTL